MVKIEDYDYLCEEEKRLRQDKLGEKYWKKWGPYVAERQWATGKLPNLWNELAAAAISYPMSSGFLEFVELNS